MNTKDNKNKKSTEQKPKAAQKSPETRYKQTDDLLEAFGSQQRNQTLSNEKFEALWNKAENSGKTKKTIRLRFYAIAASIALMLSVGGSILFQHINDSMQRQYAQGQQAIEQIAYYLNKSQSKMHYVNKINETFDAMQPLKKGEEQLEKIELLKYYPIQ